MTDYPFTFKCNNNCITCINNTEIVSKRRDPPVDEIKRVIDRIDPRVDYFGVGGGEPTLSEHFFDLLRYARKKHPNLYIFITTNGRMFHYEEFAKKLADLQLGNFLVAVALYGHTPELHDFITRVRGSFEQTISGIENLLKHKIPVEIRVIINRFNYKHLPEIAMLVSKRFPKIKRFVFVNMKYTGNAFINREKVFVRISEVVPYALEGVKILKGVGINTRLYHFPLCILPEEYREIAKGVTKAEEEELTFVKACEECKLRDQCPRIWKTYVALFGEEEFKPIR
ncbi:MAG: radical SAM protein [Candidatus Aenigmarchaeota archaeon]|nr:radical SAM protein [Candidatus Aenigmarchaeota archaeon]